MQSVNYKKYLLLLGVLASSYALLAGGVSASKMDELKTEIQKRNEQISKIEKDITKYEKQVDETLKKKKTLKNEMYRLQISAKKLNSDIYVTRKKVEASSFNIEKLTLEIGDKTKETASQKEVLAGVIRRMNELESQSLVEFVLVNDKFSDFFSDIQGLGKIQDQINSGLKEIKTLKSILQSKKSAEQAEREKQTRLKAELLDRKYLVDRNKSVKNKLLKETKNKEANYRSLLEDRIAKRKQFEKDLMELESQLRIEIDPNSIPPSGKGVFMAPLPDVAYSSCYNGSTQAKNCLTQFFGKTQFAKSGAYNGRGHNGADFRAAIGTKVKAVLGGTIVGTGNTDLIRGCLSYGKWVLVKHDNGLSTLYAHLSLIKVKKGQTVSTGDIIAYSGNSGYSTGPHLHLTAYASQGVEITRLGDIKKITNCANAYIPIAPFNAYLNPLDYL